jgi:hypothetical protein
MAPAIRTACPEHGPENHDGTTVDDGAETSEPRRMSLPLSRAQEGIRFEADALDDSRAQSPEGEMAR